MNDNEPGQSVPQDPPDASFTAVAEPPRPAAGGCPTCGRLVPGSNAPCPTCGAGQQWAATSPAVPVASASPPEPRFVYAIGRVDYRFPSLAVEKELAQIAGSDATASLTDRAVIARTLQNSDNRYVARQMCWVLTVQGMDTYLLYPRESMDLDMLLGTVREEPQPADLDAVIGVRGPVAPPELCNGLMLPIVFVDQLYSFDTESLLEAIPRPDSIQAREFKSAAREVFDRIRDMADNAGSSDEHRALNYMVVRAPTLYGKTAEQYGREFALTAVDARRSALPGGRRIIEVVLSYTHRTSDFTEKWFTRVDVTEQFPFLVTKLSPYYDR